VVTVWCLIELTLIEIAMEDGTMVKVRLLVCDGLLVTVAVMVTA
jgi:hypothetical protein